MRRRNLIAFAALAALACALAGCVRVDRGVALNTDGSGSYTVAVAFSDKLVQAAGASFTQQMQTCADTVASQGGKASHGDDGAYATWTFTWAFASVDGLNALLARGTTFCQAPTAPGVAAAALTDPVEVIQHTRTLTSTFVVRGHVSLSLPAATVNLQDPAVAALWKDARVSFSVTMPNWVTSYTSGGAVNGRTVTYTAKAGEGRDFEVVGGGPTTYGLLAGLGVLAALLAVALLVAGIARRIRRKKAERARSAALAASSSPR